MSARNLTDLYIKGLPTYGLGTACGFILSKGLYNHADNKSTDYGKLFIYGLVVGLYYPYSFPYSVHLACQHIYKKEY